MQSNSRTFLWVSVVFLLLSVSFIFDMWGDKREIVKHPLVEPKNFTKEPVRSPKLKAVIDIEGHRYSCNDCHQTIMPSKVQKKFFSAHPDIILDHGVNNYCMTCHNSEDREMLIDINKGEVPFNQSQKSCLQCHGPIYRDWQEGVHGRINDFWSSEKGETRKLTCVACHDPHQPKFKSMKPAPGPKQKNYQDFLKRLIVKDDHHE